MTLTEEQRGALARAIDYINETDLPVGELDGFDREVLRAMIDSSDPITDVTELVELLAAGEHEQWAAWAQAILDSEPGLSDGRKAAWPGLIATPYENLSEEMKDEDRRVVHLRSQVVLDYIQQQSAEIERLRAENEEALESLTAAYLLGRHEKAQEVAARPKEGKIDSSGTVEPTGGFDLERARGLRDFLQDDCAEVGDVWGEMIAEIERLRAENEEAQESLTAAYMLGSHEKAHEQAAHISELEVEIAELKADLEQSEICIQARLDVIDQQAARIKSLKKEIRRLKHESKVEQEFTNSYIKRLHDAEARIKELEAQCEDLMQNCNSLRERAWKAEVRIKEQDDALVEERAGAIRCESYDHCEGIYRIDLPDAMIRAQQELQAEGKIGPDAAKPQSWQITDERKATLSASLKVLERLKKNNTDTDHSYLDWGITVLRAMLREAE